MASLSSALSAAAVTAAEGASLSSLPTLFVARPPHSFVSFSQKSIRLSLRKFSPLLPLVAARASDWGAPQVTAEEEESAVGSVSEWEDGQAELGEEVEDGGADLVAAGDAGTGGEDEESYPEPPEEAKLFVGNLPFDIDSEGLAKLFDEAGVVEIAEVIYNRNTDQSRGFGFVTMSTVEEADIAVEKFNRYELNGRSLTVNKAAPRGSAPQRPPREFAPTFRMYVGNLPWQVDDARLEQVFSEHGKVLDARVVYDRDSGRSRGFGFVSMSSKAELDDAIAALDGQSLDGRSIRVTVAEERARRSSF